MPRLANLKPSFALSTSLQPANHSWSGESPGVTVPHNMGDGEEGVGRGDRIWSPKEERGTPVKVAWEEPSVTKPRD